MITVVIGKIIHGVFVLGRSYYSGSGWYNDDGSFYIWSCCNQSSICSRFYGIFTQALLMVTCLFFPDTAKDNKGIIMVIRTMKVENSFISFLRVY